MEAVRLGIDLGGTKMLVLVDGPRGTTAERLPTGPEFTPDAFLDALEKVIGSLERRPASIGIAVPGLVGEDGTVLACDVLPRFVGWSARELHDLADTVWVMNDAEAALVEETRELQNADAALVMIGTRIGAAFMTAGHIIKGARGWAGELGYLPVVRNEAMATLDDVASGEALIGQLGIEGERLSERIEAGDPSVREAVEEAGRWLGVGLAAVINLLNPELLVIGGGTARLPGYLDAALRSAQAAALPDLWSCCRIREASAGDEVVARGVSRMSSTAQAELSGQRRTASHVQTASDAKGTS